MKLYLRVYLILKKDFALKSTLKAINDTSGPDGVILTLLIFGYYPRMTQLDPPSPSIPNRDLAIKKAMHEINKLRASRQIMEALRQRNGPRTDQVLDLPLNFEVIVCQDNNNSKG